MPSYLWALTHLGLAVWGVYHVLLYKRDPQSALGWIMACVFIPWGGPLAYFLFGINRVKKRAKGLRGRFSVGREGGRPHEPAPDQNRDPSSDQSSDQSADPTDDAAVQVPGVAAMAAAHISGRPARAGNHLRVLHNGETAYPAMLAAIDAARERVWLATYIFQGGRTGEAFVDALSAAADRGLDVRVLVDGVGERYAWRRASVRLRRRGVPVARFLPPSLVPPSLSLNLRNHRKLLVTDGSDAFLGGMNLSDDHRDWPDRPRTITDVQFHAQGPLVMDLAGLFARDWHFVTGETLAPQAAGGRQEEAGDALCRMVPDGPDADLDALAVTIMAMASSARHQIDIMTPYFLPSRELLSALQSAALRGVRVRIVLPAVNNLVYVHWANRNLLADLLWWDVQVFYQPAPFCHSKLLCIDDAYVLIGSANLDPRSLRLNFEVGVEIVSEPLNQQLRDHFDAVIATSSALTLEQLGARSVLVRLRDSAAALLSPYL
ncbi:MAG TPA: phospholipase D-like domain-containing protein [Pseudomonadales bacterium]|nr:phospholipase D-like domain-containing protein [Pseudomonadales bacterium]